MLGVRADELHIHIFTFTDFFGHCDAGFFGFCTFWTISSDVAFFSVHFLDIRLRYQYHGNERWYETQKIYSHLNAGATCGFPAKYTEITLSRLNFITNNFFSGTFSQKFFCTLLNNIMSFHWNNFNSFRTSGLEITAVWSWLQFFPLTL